MIVDREFWNTYYRERATILNEEADELLVKELTSRSPGYALDLGAGAGHNSIWLAQHGWRVLALDYAQSAVDLLEKRRKELQLEMSAYCVDITQDYSHILQGQKFQLVCICHMHLAIDERQAIIEHAKEALATGGLLIYIAITKNEIHDAEFNACCPSPEEIQHYTTDLKTLQARVQIRDIPIDEGEYFRGETYFHLAERR